MTAEAIPYYPNPKPKRNPGFLAPRESGELQHLRQENRILQRELIRAHERIRELEEQQQRRATVYEDDEDDNFSVEVVESVAPSVRTSSSSVTSSAHTVPIANTTPLAATKTSKKNDKRRSRRRIGSNGSTASAAMKRITEISQSFSNMSTTSDLTSVASMSSSGISDNGLRDSSIYAIRSLLQSETGDDSIEDEESLVSFESSLFGEL
mmetsp:Transcript_537/g.810  ORF Transcript_537/g.810 Transcript_537/m.810 type:complete len:209 (-) Transcript_537:45-671(-)